MMQCEWGYQDCTQAGGPEEFTTHDGGLICWSCLRTGEAEYADFVSCARGR